MHRPRVHGLACVLMLVLSAALFPVLAKNAHAQSASATGRLEGTVTDPTGAAVPDAEISVRNQNTGIATTIQSSADGEFTALYLDPGIYEVSIQKPGFGKLVLRDLTISVGTRAVIHPQLRVGKIDAVITSAPKLRSSTQPHLLLARW